MNYAAVLIKETKKSTIVQTPQCLYLVISCLPFFSWVTLARTVLYFWLVPITQPHVSFVFFVVFFVVCTQQEIVTVSGESVLKRTFGRKKNKNIERQKRNTEVSFLPRLVSSFRYASFAWLLRTVRNKMRISFLPKQKNSRKPRRCSLL